MSRRRIKGDRRRQKVQALKERDGECCWYCGKFLGTDETLEHIIPSSIGGSDRNNNLALAHNACNNFVGSRPIEEKHAIRGLLRGGVVSFATMQATLGATEPILDWLVRILSSNHIAVDQKPVVELRADEPKRKRRVKTVTKKHRKRELRKARRRYAKHYEDPLADSDTECHVLPMRASSDYGTGGDSI